MNKIEFIKSDPLGTEKFIILNRKKYIEVKSDQKHFNARRVIGDFVVSCINMDEWKHGWHMDARSYRKDKSVYRKIKKIIEDKISVREKEIKRLQFCLKLMRRTDIRSKES